MHLLDLTSKDHLLQHSCICWIVCCWVLVSRARPSYAKSEKPPLGGGLKLVWNQFRIVPVQIFVHHTLAFVANYMSGIWQAKTIIATLLHVLNCLLLSVGFDKLRPFTTTLLHLPTVELFAAESRIWQHKTIYYIIPAFVESFVTTRWIQDLTS